jgi:hypothetical protein
MVKQLSGCGCLVVLLALLTPMLVLPAAFWLIPEANTVVMFIFLVFLGPPICWMFAGIGCWLGGRIRNRNGVTLTCLNWPVEYWGLLYFIGGLALILLFAARVWWASLS